MVSVELRGCFLGGGGWGRGLEVTVGRGSVAGGSRGRNSVERLAL